MNTAAKLITQQIDEVLKPLGFNKRKATWNRRCGVLIDVIDVQVSKSGDLVKANAGVCDADIHKECWGESPENFLQEADCTVRASVGELMDGKDRWWSLTDSRKAEDLTDKVRLHLLPFLDQMHSTDAMQRFLTRSGAAKQKYPPPMISLALLRHRRGDLKGACRLLSDLSGKATGAWQKRVREIAERLKCNSDSGRPGDECDRERDGSASSPKSAITP